MADRWRWRALRLAHGPDEVWLVAAQTLGEMLTEARATNAAASAKGDAGSGGGRQPAGADRGQPVEPQRLPIEHALALFDGAFREATFALRAFARDNGLEPGVGLVREHHVLSHVRRQIAIGALVALRPAARAAPPKRPPSLRVAASSSASSPAAPTPIRRGPAPPPASLEDEGPEFTCPGPQAQALREAAEAGVPFCAECQRAAAARAGSGPT